MEVKTCVCVNHQIDLLPILRDLCLLFIFFAMVRYVWNLTLNAATDSDSDSDSDGAPSVLTPANED